MSKLRMFWEQDKSNDLLLTELINHYRQQDDSQSILDVFEQMPSEVMTDELCLQKIESLIHSSQFSKVEQAIDEIKDKENYQQSIIYFKALVTFLAGDLPQTIDVLTEKIEQSIFASKVLLMRALYLQGDFKKALEIQNFISPEEVTPEALGLISLINLDSGSIEIARKQANGVLAVSPYNVDALIVEASMQVFHQNINNANELLDRCLQAMPHIGRAWSLKGQVAFLSFDFDSAFSHLTQALIYMKDHIGTWHLYAWTCLLRNQITEAKEAFNTSLELNNKFGDTYGGLAVIAFVENDIVSAEKLAKKGLRLDKSSASSHYAKSLLEEKAGDEQQAISRIKELLSNESHLSGHSYIDLVSQAIRKVN